MEQRSGRQLRLVEVVGKGGFGIVWRAILEDGPLFRKTVALKMLHPERSKDSGAVDRVRAEATILARIRHRAVIGVQGLLELQGGPALLMEFIDGIDLSLAIRRARPPLPVVLEVVEEVAGALYAAAHVPPVGEPAALGLLHRDVKPSNIRITRDGEVKLLDFGVALGVVQEDDRLWGSARYLAPERRQGKSTHQGDIYALGIVLANALSGKRFAEPPATASEHARFLRGILDEVNEGFEDPEEAADVRLLILEMLAFEADDRPDGWAVEQRCRRIRSGLPTPWLRDWAKATVPRLSQEAAADLAESIRALNQPASGTVLVEDTQRAGQSPASIAGFSANLSSRKAPPIPLLAFLSGSVFGAGVAWLAIRLLN
jgi:serine/threonine protein kinase